MTVTEQHLEVVKYLELHQEDINVYALLDLVPVQAATRNAAVFLITAAMVAKKKGAALKKMLEALMNVAMDCYADWIV